MSSSTAYLEPRIELEPSFDCSLALKLMNVERSVNARSEFCLKYISTKPERGSEKTFMVVFLLFSCAEVNEGNLQAMTSILTSPHPHGKFFFFFLTPPVT